MTNETKHNLAFAGLLLTILVVAGFTVRDCFAAHQRRVERHAAEDRKHAETLQSLRDIGTMMDECTVELKKTHEVLADCTTDYRDCVDTLAECRDLAVCCALFVERTTGVPIPRGVLKIDAGMGSR